MAEKTNLMTPREFVAHLGFRPHYGHQLLKDGRLVLAPDGKNVLVAESIARMQETADPALGATVARHAPRDRRRRSNRSRPQERRTAQMTAQTTPRRCRAQATPAKPTNRPAPSKSASWPSKPSAPTR